MQGFLDADLSRDVDSSKNTFEYIYIIDGTIVNWMSRFHKCVAFLSTEAKYVTIAETGQTI